MFYTSIITQIQEQKKSKSALFKTNLDCLQSFEIIDVYKSREVDEKKLINQNTKSTLKPFNVNLSIFFDIN